jgi:enoyl-CoA hydratase/carnithine racemase
MEIKEYKTLEVSQQGPVVEVVLNRPQARNAMTFEMLAEFDSVLDLAQADDSVKAVMVTGNGPVFTAGHDLKEVAEWFATPEGIAERKKTFRVPALERSWYFTKPLIAGVHGYVGPHGVLLLSYFDFIIAAEGTRFSFEQTRSGGGIPHSILPLLIPPRAYLKLGIFGGWFSAETARRWDFVQRVVPTDEVRSVTRQWADEISKIPTLQVQSIKDLAHRQMEAMGIMNMVRPINPGGHGSKEDMEFFSSVISKGLRESLAGRDGDFDNEIAEI